MTAEGNGTIRIESHDDDSVTLTVGTLIARISAASWVEANEAAWKLGKLVQGRAELKTLLSRVSYLSQTVSDLERLTRAAHDNLSLLVADLTPEHGGEGSGP